VETVKAGGLVVQTEQRAVSLELEEPNAKFFDEVRTTRSYGPLSCCEGKRREKAFLGTRICKSTVR